MLNLQRRRDNNTCSLLLTVYISMRINRAFFCSFQVGKVWSKCKLALGMQQTSLQQKNEKYSLKPNDSKQITKNTNSSGLIILCMETLKDWYPKYITRMHPHTQRITSKWNLEVTYQIRWKRTRLPGDILQSMAD